MKWVTREKAKVDRIACPWLIKKFIDKNAEFIFVPQDKVMDVAKREKATPFDVPGAEIGHHGEKCSFDALVEKYKLDDPAIKCLAFIVRGADTDMNDPPPESGGLEAAAEGFRALSRDDHESMRMQFPLYDALYEHCRIQVGKR
jgi:hypothetical protein